MSCQEYIKIAVKVKTTIDKELEKDLDKVIKKHKFVFVGHGCNLLTSCVDIEYRRHTMDELYCVAPEDKYFDELKKKAIEVWGRYIDASIYALGKINEIKDVKNVRGNFMHIVTMFDMSDQKQLSKKLSVETRRAVRERMVDGRFPEDSIVF